MECIIHGQNLKVLSKAIQSLSKIGDELHIQPSDTQFSLLSLNLAKTICAQFNFFNNFFTSYEVKKENLICKLHMKIAIPIFRGNLDKKLDYLQIQYEDESDFIYFKIKYLDDDIVILHKIRLLECDIAPIGIHLKLGCNNICAPSIFFNELLKMFNIKDDELTMEFTKNNVIVRNYCAGVPRIKTKTMRSQVTLNAGEFELFQINEETNLNYSLRPLRTAISFADGFNLNITINFQIGNKPLKIIMKHDTFEVNFIVATLNPACDDASTTLSSAATINNNNNNNNNNKVTQKDCTNLVNNNDIEAMDSQNLNEKNVETHEIDNFFITEKAKFVFGRAFEPSFFKIPGEIVAPNSDSD